MKTILPLIENYVPITFVIGTLYIAFTLKSFHWAAKYAVAKQPNSITAKNNLLFIKYFNKIGLYLAVSLFLLVSLVLN